jgi:hypothetical protein
MTKRIFIQGDVHMDIVRIGIFLGELYGLSSYACNIGNTFLHEKTKKSIKLLARNSEQVYMIKI